MTQRERREFLIRSMLLERPEYGNVSIPTDDAGQQRLLRSLFNLRPPQPPSEAFLQIQDAYLRQEAAQKPLLGICLGMQLLFDRSFEYGEHPGLGLVPGQVCPLAPDLTDPSLKVPQIGWNALHILRDDPLFRYIREGEHVYYVHSYYAKDCAPSTLAVSEYSIPVTGVVRAGRVYGAQFHPEKSGDTGLRILRAFAEL